MLLSFKRILEGESVNTYDKVGAFWGPDLSMFGSFWGRRLDHMAIGNGFAVVKKIS